MRIDLIEIQGYRSLYDVQVKPGDLSVLTGPNNSGVVVKNSMYENWLVADLDAFRRQSGRFRITRSMAGAIVPNKADKINAKDLIRRMVVRSSYEKVTDSKRIMSRADPARIASNSRSFRRFLREAGYPTYSVQTRKP